MEIKAIERHLDLTRIETMEMAMLYNDRDHRFSLARWLQRVGLVWRARRVTDIRELSPYLRADIGAWDGDQTFRG